MILCFSALAVNQLLIAMGGSITFLGILGEISRHLDDYTRNPSSTLFEGETESD